MSKVTINNQETEAEVSITMALPPDQSAELAAAQARIAELEAIVAQLQAKINTARQALA